MVAGRRSHERIAAASCWRAYLQIVCPLDRSSSDRLSLDRLPLDCLSLDCLSLDYLPLDRLLLDRLPINPLLPHEYPRPSRRDALPADFVTPFYNLWQKLAQIIISRFDLLHKYYHVSNIAKFYLHAQPLHWQTPDRMCYTFRLRTCPARASGRDGDDLQVGQAMAARHRRRYGTLCCSTTRTPASAT